MESNWSKALCSMATLFFDVSTDSSLGMAVRVLVTFLKSRLRRSIQLVLIDHGQYIRCIVLVSLVGFVFGIVAHEFGILYFREVHSLYI